LAAADAAHYQMKPRYKALGIGAAITTLVTWLLWQFGPFQPVIAVAHLSDPAKLASLGERGANPRLNKIVYWLHEAKTHGLPPTTAVGLAQTLNWTREPRASLVKESLSRNMKIATELGLFTSENLKRLRHGRAGMITKGPYIGSAAEIDHIVPYSLAKEVGNELANLEMLPEPLNRRKSNRVGERQVAHARRLFEAGLLSKESLARVEARSGGP
jgi:hypothetical protein